VEYKKSEFFTILECVYVGNDKDMAVRHLA